VVFYVALRGCPGLRAHENQRKEEARAP